MREPQYVRALARDSTMRAVIADVGRLPSYYKERTDFEAVCRIIVGQQLSYAAATTIWGRMRGLCKPWIPKTVASMRVQKLRLCGLSVYKARFIKEMAAAIVREELDFAEIRVMQDPEAIAALSCVRGLGPWSIEMFLIFAMDRADVFSISDAGLRRAICQLYSVPRNLYHKKVARIADQWRPYRSYACRYLWAWLDRDTTNKDC